MMIDHDGADTIYFAGDVINMLSAIGVVNENLTAQSTDHGTQMYRTGFNACLEAVAIALGIDLANGVVGVTQPGLRRRHRRNPDRQQTLLP